MGEVQFKKSLKKGTFCPKNGVQFKKNSKNRTFEKAEVVFKSGAVYERIWYIKCNILSKSSKWKLGSVHYIAKFTILRFVISRFECRSLVRASVGEQKLDFALSICIQNGWENETPKYLVGMFILGKTQNF